MEAHVTYAPVLWAVILGALLVGVLAIAVGGMAFTTVRRRGSLGSNLALVAAAVVGLCLLIMIMLAGGLYSIRMQRLEEVRRVEIQARLRHIGEELHAKDAFEQAQRLREQRALDPSIPVEAPQPDEVIALVAGDGERLLRGTPAEPLPEWVTTGTVDDGDRRLVVVRGQQFADQETARRDALQKAVELVRRNFEQSIGHPSDRFALDSDVVSSLAVRDSHTEEIRRTAGDNDFIVYRTYLQVEQSPQVREALEPIWRQQVSRGRSMMVIGLLALLTAVAGLLSGYFRLDDRTGGRYRWRLRLAAVAATVLIGGTLFAGTRIASNAVRHCPLQTPQAIVDTPAAPPEARTLPSETSVDEERRQRFQEIADHIVAAINAGDFEGVRRDFNENMLDRFPPETCREFFREKIVDKYGTIHSLEPAQFKSRSTAVYAARCERGSLSLILVLDEQNQVAGLVLLPRTAHSDGHG